MADEENQNEQVVGDDGVLLDDLKDSIDSQGGQVSSMPTQGYCLVFNAETDWYTMKVDQGILKVERNPDMDENTWNEEGYEQKLKDAMGRRRNNVLLGFKKANIQYKIMCTSKVHMFFHRKWTPPGLEKSDFVSIMKAIGTTPGVPGSVSLNTSSIVVNV